MVPPVERLPVRYDGLSWRVGVVGAEPVLVAVVGVAAGGGCGGAGEAGYGVEGIDGLGLSSFEAVGVGVEEQDGVVGGIGEDTSQGGACLLQGELSGLGGGEGTVAFELAGVVVDAEQGVG